MNPFFFGHFWVKTHKVRVIPLSFEDPPIVKDASAEAMSLVVVELSDVSLRIRPDHLAIPLHLVLDPVILVLFNFWPNVVALTINLVLFDSPIYMEPFEKISFPWPVFDPFSY